MNFTSGFAVKETESKNEYFVGMNTGRGFVGKYSEIINEKKLSRLYIIKGAAGTGKSTLMKRCAKAAEDEGHSVVYYLCSSDPDSLDCVVIDGKVAILDGTSPHNLDMIYPGAVSELVDVTNFWDSQKLASCRKELISITDTKKTAFSDAYSLLSDISALALERYNSSVRAIDLDKLDRYISRLTSSFGKGKGSGKSETAVVRSVGMKGCIRLDTLEKCAERVIAVTDVYASAYHFMDILAGKLRSSGFDILISPDPVTPDLICDIYIPQISTLVTLDANENFDKRINMARFIDNKKLGEIRGLMRLSLKCSNALFDEVSNMFSLGGRSHFELERIYSSSMDFEALTAYADQLEDRIIKLLQK